MVCVNLYLHDPFRPLENKKNGRYIYCLVAIYSTEVQNQRIYRINIKKKFFISPPISQKFSPMFSPSIARPYNMPALLVCKKVSVFNPWRDGITTGNTK